MSRKIFIIIAIVLVIFIFALVAYYFLAVSNGNNPAGDMLGFKQFFPFGGTAPVSTTTPANNATSTQPIVPAQNYIQKLRKIWAEPVAGAGLLDVKAGTVVRHVEVATGHIYETELFSPVQNRISNTTMPLVYNAVWGNKNKSFIAQYLADDNETINTYVLSVKDTATSTQNPVSGYVLANDIEQTSVLGNTMFYLEQTSAGTQGFISGLDGLKRKQIWNSPLKELLPQLVSDTTVTLTTKPHQNVPGFMYSVSANTGAVKKILGNIGGLSALMSPDASKVLYSSQNFDSQMFLYSTKDRTSKNLTPATFPEKCVWSKKDANIVYCAVPREYLDGSSLDSWYMGMISFTDDIWKYDLKQNTSSIVGNLMNESGEAIDAIKPLLSDSEQYFVFINKRDGSLWSLDLSK